MNIERKNPGQDKEGIVDEVVRAIREVRVPEGPPAEVVESVLAIAEELTPTGGSSKFELCLLVLLGIVLAACKLIDLMPGWEFSLLVKLLPLIAIAAAFFCIRINPFKINPDLKLEGV